jgi:hypothetical protein
MTSWKKPSFTDVSMNAEIGAYQDDQDHGNAPIVERAEAEASREASRSDRSRGPTRSARRRLLCARVHQPPALVRRVPDVAAKRYAELTD